MDWRIQNWYVTVPFDKDQHLYVSHFIFANHTSGGWIINVHRICLNQCIAGTDQWISDVARTERKLQQLPMRPSGPDWDHFWRIFTSSRTITIGWALEQDAIAMRNTFGIQLISTKREQHFLPNPNLDKLLNNQMQCLDLQKIDGRGPMPNLAGYIGDSEAKK